MFRFLVKFFAPVLLGTLFPMLLIASEISEPLKGEIRTHLALIETKAGPYHFELHFNPSDEVYVTQVLAFLERDTNALADYFDYAPSDPIHIMLSKTNYANGSATVFPHNLINLYKFPPVGGEHLMAIDSWLRGLVLHELVHIIHMDQTRGVLKGLRTVFGSVGKLGGVTPRWFTEGIAVWAETHFTEGGRLRSALLNYELKKLMNDPMYCQKMDCLDTPGLYPGGQLAYWAGGSFMDYLESQKPGSIRCLIFENSSQIPFFLNRVFKKCTGESASAKFQKFRATFKSDQSVPLHHSKDWIASYQARLLLTPKGLVRTGRARRTPELTLLDEKEQLTFLARAPGYIETFLPASPESQQRNESLVTLIAHQSGFAPREIWRYDTQALKFIEEVSVLRNYEAAFGLSDKDYLALRYERHHWHLDHIMGDKKSELKTFPALAHVRYSHLMKKNDEHFLIYGLTELGKEGSEKFSIQKLTLKNNEVKGSETLVAGEGPLKIIGQCEMKTFVSDDAGVFEIDFSAKNTRATRMTGRPILVTSNGPQVSYLIEGSVRPVSTSCAEFSQAFKGERYKLHSDKRNPSSKEEASTLATVRYPRVSHLIPKYWLFDYITGSNLDALRVYTSLSDPLMRHTLNLGLNHYPQISKSVPTADYTYARSYFRLLGSYDKSYTKSSITQREDNTEVTSVGIGFDRWWGRYNVALTGIYANKETSDFISERKIDEVSVNLGLYRMGTFYDSFFGDTQLQMRALRSSPEGLVNYWGQQYRLLQSLHLLPRTKLNLTGTFGRLDKSDFRSGVIYGGGSSNYNSSYFHEFYGLSYSDAYGNELSTGRAQLDITAYNVYSAGGGLFPLFLKELHLLGGAEFIHADRIFVGGSFVRNDKITSYHAGVRLLANAFYFIPIQSDILYVSTENPFGARENEMLFLLRGNLSL